MLVLTNIIGGARGDLNSARGNNSIGVLTASMCLLTHSYNEIVEQSPWEPSTSESRPRSRG